MKYLICMLAALALGGCGNSKAATDVAAVPSLWQPPPPAPAECKSGDPAWRDIPAAGAKSSEVARLWAANKRNYRRVLAARRVCRAGHVAAEAGSKSTSR